MTAPQENEGRLDRIVTVPNAISLGRLFCVPLFLWLLFGRENRVGAALLLAGLGATDWVDGYIARHFDQVSNLGKILDPAADRILLGVGGVAIIVDGSIPAWVGILALSRELVVGAAGIVLGLMGARRIDVLLVGKAGNFLLMLAFPLFLASNPDGGAHGTPWPGRWPGCAPSPASCSATTPPTATSPSPRVPSPRVGGGREG